MKPYIFSYSHKICIQDDGWRFDAESQVSTPLAADNKIRSSNLDDYKVDFTGLANGTTITESIESNDEDHLFLSQSTLITYVIESSDHDEFHLCSTLVTSTVEDIDHDELHHNDLAVAQPNAATEYLNKEDLYSNDSTLMTKSIEPADDDEYLLH